MAAARLKPGDHDVARALVNLSGSTGRKDALTLTAVGTALMTLGRPSAAIPPLRRALELSPDLVTAKDRLRLAERAVAANEGGATAIAATVPGSASATDPSIGPYSNEAEESRSN
jgi:hypothetical protein